MVDTGRHIIEKLNVDVYVDGMPAARRLYGSMSAFIQERVMPVVEGMFDEMTPAGMHLNAGVITIDVELPGEDSLETRLPQAVTDAVNQAIQEKLKRTGLKSGGLPEWMAVATPFQKNTPANAGLAHDAAPAVQISGFGGGKDELTGVASSKPDGTAAEIQPPLTGKRDLPDEASEAQSQAAPYSPQPGIQEKPELPFNEADTATPVRKSAPIIDEPVSAAEYTNPDSEKNAQTPGETDMEWRNLSEKTKSIFIYFLQTGKLPWYAGTQTAYLEETHLLQTAFGDASWVTSILNNAFNRLPDTFMERWVLQFSPAFIMEIVIKYGSVNPAAAWQRVQERRAILPEAQGRQLQQVFLALLLQAVFTHPVPQEVLDNCTHQLLDQFAPASATASATEDTATENPVLETGEPLPAATVLKIPANGLPPEKSITDAYTPNKILAANTFLKKKAAVRSVPAEEMADEQGVLLGNGGLVLLHPFLEMFFKECELVSGGKFTGDAEQQTAVHLLHYLATGMEQPFEPDTLFAQYLCNWPPGEPLNRFITLSEKMKTECDELLKAAVGHWKALKNTSLDGLRQGFLQREAKLVAAGGYHKLLVAPNTVDVLLQQLPWGIAMVQLPWMPQLLHVEWTY